MITNISESSLEVEPRRNLRNTRIIIIGVLWTIAGIASIVILALITREVVKVIGSPSETNPWTTTETSTGTTSDKEECEIDPISSDAPLIITSNGTQILYPLHGSNTLRFTTGETADFVCPGGAVVLDGQSTGSSIAQAACISNARFRVNGERFLWRQIACNKAVASEARFTGGTCSHGKEAEIGFNLGSNRFIRLILVCYDVNNQVALYSNYEVISSIGAQATSTPRPYFQENPGFYNIGNQQVNTLYLRTTQRRTINGLIGLSATDITYIKNDNWHYLARGHMAARADFFYPAQQNATFQYVNAAPQWQSFNGLNWKTVESNTRNYASQNNATLQVWTGIYGVTSLPDASTGRNVDLYLYVNGTTRGIPVPAIYWRVVYNPVTRRGVALIGLNNPYETNLSQYVFCNDVSGNLNWLTWNRTNIYRGYSYACTIADLRKEINYIPNLTVTGLLV